MSKEADSLSRAEATPQAGLSAADIRIRGYTLTELAAQYNPRIAVPDHESWKRQWSLWSQWARERLHGQFDHRYGSRPRQRADVFPAAKSGSPINIFTHGGFWRFLDKSDHSVVALPLVESGATVVMLNYELCPNVALPDQVAMLRQAVAWVHENAAKFNGDPSKIFVSGHSAGGHLTAMLAASGWQGELGLPDDVIKGAVVVSGLFELDPMRFIPGGEELLLTETTARQFSPMFNLPRSGMPMVVAVGELETHEWIRQTDDYVSALKQNGNPTTLFKVQVENHYSVFLTLANRVTDLCKNMLSQMGLQ